MFLNLELVFMVALRRKVYTCFFHCLYLESINSLFVYSNTNSSWVYPGIDMSVYDNPVTRSRYIGYTSLTFFDIRNETNVRYFFFFTENILHHCYLLTLIFSLGQFTQFKTIYLLVLHTIKNQFLMLKVIVSSFLGVLSKIQSQLPSSLLLFQVLWCLILLKGNGDHSH